MPVIQISKIQVRRGPEIEVGPDTLSPGEFGLATDTGRLFVGTDPASTGLWTDRNVSPYDNLEVLTEASDDTFARLFDRMNRVIGPVALAEGHLPRRPYLEATLVTNADWQPVMLTRINNATGLPDLDFTEEFVIADSLSGGAQLQYFIFDGTTLIRSGEITIVHDGDQTAEFAYMCDEYTTHYIVSSSAEPLSADELFDTGVRFAGRLVGSSPDLRVRLEYQSDSVNPLTLQVRGIVGAKFPPP
jgi:hypothetical protein